jgi:hypothetical protein
MQITVQHDIKRLLPRLEQFSSRQAPFTIAKAITSTAQLVRDEVHAQIPVAFDKPNPFTRRAFTIQRAEKRNLTAFVFAKDKQARYLKFGVQGGARRVKGFERYFGAGTSADEQAGAALVPTRNVKTDSFGGVSLATIKAIQRQVNTGGKTKRYFLGKPRGGGKNAAAGYGIYARVNANKKLQAVMLFKQPPRYEKRLDLPGIGRKVVAANFAAQLEQAWKFAMRTAR